MLLPSSALTAHLPRVERLVPATSATPAALSASRAASSRLCKTIAAAAEEVAIGKVLFLRQLRVRIDQFKYKYQQQQQLKRRQHLRQATHTNQRYLFSSRNTNALCAISRGKAT